MNKINFFAILLASLCIHTNNSCGPHDHAQEYLKFLLLHAASALPFEPSVAQKETQCYINFKQKAEKTRRPSKHTLAIRSGKFCGPRSDRSPRKTSKR